MNFLLIFFIIFFVFSGKGCSSESISEKEAKDITDRKSILKIIQKSYTEKDIQEFMILNLLYSCNSEDVSIIEKYLNSEYFNVQIAAIEWLRLCKKPSDNYVINLLGKMLNENNTQVLIYILDFLNESNHPEKIKILNNFLEKYTGKNKILENWIQYLLKENN